MLRLPVCMLLVAFVSAEPQQEGFGYLPPRPSEPTAVVCNPVVTSTAYVIRERTSVALETVIQINTIFRTTTIVQRQVVPTTIYTTRVLQKPQFSTSIIQSTAVQFKDRVIDQTVPSPNIVRTQYTTISRVVPQVSYVTREQVQTQRVPVEVVRTAVTTVERTNINTRTQQVQRTSAVTVTGRDVVQTRVQTVRQTSVVQRQLPAQTRVITSTRIQDVVNTRTVQGPNQFRTSVVQRQQVVPTTSVIRRLDNQFVTRTNIVTRTNTRYQTNYQDKVVSQEFVSTRVVPTTIFTTRYVTQAQPVERVQTRTNYRTVTPNPVVETRRVTETSVQQVQGENRVINREVVQTQQRQKIVYETVNRAQVTTVTTTTTSICQPGYNYDVPATPFIF